MKPLRIIFLFLLAFWSESTCVSQETKQQNEYSALPVAPTTALQETGKPIPTSLPRGSIFGSIRCDTEGRSYFRMNVGSGDVTQGPIFRLSHDGKADTFDFRTIPGYGKYFSALQFAVDPGGKVYAIVRTGNARDGLHQYIVSFLKDGSFGTKIELNGLLLPYAFTALPSGGFLVSGLEDSLTGDIHRSSTFIVDENGAVKKDLTDKRDDLAYNKDAGNKDLQNEAIQTGDALLGADGDLYVFKGSSPPRVQVFNEGGEKLREVTLKPPMDKGKAFEYRISQGKIFVVFVASLTVDSESPRKRPMSSLSVFDAPSGEPLMNFDPPKGIWMCVDSDRLTFLRGGMNSNFELFHADLPK